MRKGRSRVIERNHTLILGWSPTVFAIIGELIIANENQRRPRIVILADHDKVPQVVFCDPQVAAVGITAAQARHRGEAPVAARFRLGGKRRRNPGVDLLAGEEEVCRHDAHDGVGDAVEAQRALVDEVHQAAGRGDHDVGAGLELAALAAVADAAVDDGGADVGEAAEVAEGSLDLRAAGEGRLTRTADRPLDLESARPHEHTDETE